MKPYLKHGSYNAICDRCGFKFKAEDLRQEWTGLMVCAKDFEHRNPQDFLRLPKEDISVPWTRPTPDNSFITFRLLDESGNPLQTEAGVYLGYY